MDKTCDSPFSHMFVTDACAQNCRTMSLVRGIVDEWR